MLYVPVTQEPRANLNVWTASTSTPLFTQAVPLSIDKHRELMVSVLSDPRITELQQRGGAWLAGLTNSASGLAQKSPDCRYAKPNFNVRLSVNTSHSF